MKILLVEDDHAIACGLCYSLEQDGLEVLACSDASSAMEVISGVPFDLALLDITLPDGSGYDLCRAIKKAGDTPVIFLTACDDEGNIVMGLDMGADDYVTKPFRIRELISRIHSVLRRCCKNKAAQTVYQFGNVTLNLTQGKVSKEGHEVFLTALEYRLFLTFVNHAGRVLSRSQLLSSIWDVAGDFVNDNTLTVYIKRLRDKLEDDPQNPRIIKTVRGLGYKVGD